MMDVSKPAAAISPGVDSDVLIVLAGATKPRTGREITRLAGRSKTGVQAVLDRLVGSGLVARQEAGRSYLYSLNREHLLCPVVEEMAAARTALFDRLRSELASWEKPARHASLFGSAARGDGDADSDIDLFIVRPSGLEFDDAAWRGQVDGLAERVRRWTGNHAAISEVSEDGLDQLVEEERPIAEDLKSDAVNLAGPKVRRLLAER